MHNLLRDHTFMPLFERFEFKLIIKSLEQGNSKSLVGGGGMMKNFITSNPRILGTHPPPPPPPHRNNYRTIKPRLFATPSEWNRFSYCPSPNFSGHESLACVAASTGVNIKCASELTDHFLHFVIHFTLKVNYQVFSLREKKLNAGS